jgi:mono/diheme cytochrome c family protein
MLVLGLLCMGLAQTQTQTAPAPAAPPTHGAAAGPMFPPSYPVRPPADPVVVQRGKQIFGANCGFCHGSDARGGSTGPNLIRSQLVLDDQHGELIGVVVHEGRLAKGMPKFSMADSDIADIAAYLHDQPTGQNAGAPSAPINVVVGDAKAGAAFFGGPGKCGSCHSVTGDLAGIGSKYEPKALQNLIVSGGGGWLGFGPRTVVPSQSTKVTVTLESGQKFEGNLNRLTAFIVALTDSDGVYRSFVIQGGMPKVEVHDPLQAHIDMLPKFKDSEIHDLTAYLVTIR